MCSSSLFCHHWTKLGRRQKTLLERVLENNFRPGRYGPLLAKEPLPAKPPFDDRRRRLLWARLREEQDAYQRAETFWPDDPGWYREVVAGSFGLYVCALHGSELPSYLSLERPVERRPPTPEPRPRQYATAALLCTACGCESGGNAQGWVALFAQDPHQDPVPRAQAFCPECAEESSPLPWSISADYY